MENSMNINRNNNGMNIGMVLSPAAIEAIKDELVAECSYASMVTDKNELRERLFKEYIEGLEAPIIPANSDDTAETTDEMAPAVFALDVSGSSSYGQVREMSIFDFMPGNQGDENDDALTRQDKAGKVRTRRRNAYLAKKAIGRKAEIACKNMRARWHEDRKDHVASAVMMADNHVSKSDNSDASIEAILENSGKDGVKVYKTGAKGSRTERAWRLSKKAEKIGMTGKVTA